MLGKYTKSWKKGSKDDFLFVLPPISGNSNYGGKITLQYMDMLGFFKPNCLKRVHGDKYTVDMISISLILRRFN